MTQGVYRIVENSLAAKQVYRMVLEGETVAIRRPGQFVNIRLDGFYTRRPISVCDYDAHTFTLLYKVVGDSTEYMSGLAPGRELDILVGLGNGFDTGKSGDVPLILGGGLGAAPLYGLCGALLAEGKSPLVILGFNRAPEVLLADDFAALGADAILATADGSRGVKGFVIDAIAGREYTYFYACGPEPMLRAVNERAVGSGQFSFETRMGCGFGACMSCSCKTRFESKHICKDGPVFEREEIL